MSLVSYSLNSLNFLLPLPKKNIQREALGFSITTLNVVPSDVLSMLPTSLAWDKTTCCRPFLVS